SPASPAPAGPPTSSSWAWTGRSRQIVLRFEPVGIVPGDVGGAELAVVEHGTPSAARAGSKVWVASLVQELDHAGDAVDRACERGLEQPDGDLFGVGLARLEVVAGQQAGRRADLE